VDSVGSLMATKRVRRRKRAAQVAIVPAKKSAKTAKRRNKSQVETVRALERKIAAMQINMSPFSAVGGNVGSRIGGVFGNASLGKSVGSWLGSGIGKIFGSGAYKMSQNSLWSTTDQCPVMHSTSETVVLRHREYITDVNSSVTFANTEFALNPGLPGTFPFLSTIASNFQEYNFRGLVFEFKSTSADALNSTNTALGTVAMAVQYRAGASSFTNKQQVLNEMWSADSKPAESFFMPVECSPAECPMDIQYVRTGALGNNDDIKFYDLGKLSLSTVGSQAASVVGELWASYEVALRKPILGGSIGIDIPSALLFRSGVTGGIPLGTDTLEMGINSVGVTFPSSTIIRFPVGSTYKYLVSVQWLGAVGSTYVIPTFTVSANANFITQNGITAPGVGGGTNSNGVGRCCMVYGTDTSRTFDLNVAADGTLAAPVYAYINIGVIDFDTVAT